MLADKFEEHCLLILPVCVSTWLKNHVELPGVKLLITHFDLHIVASDLLFGGIQCD